MLLVALAALGIAVAVLSTRADGLGMVRNRSRANGVDGRLLAFLDSWDATGPFPIEVAFDGGLRTDERLQARLYAEGRSRAPTLADTAHGRGGAVDVLPVGFRPSVPISKETYELFQAIGLRAEAAGLSWGGRGSDWLRAFPPSAMNPFGGDLPHIQVPGWRSLPYPPARVA